MNHLPTIHFQVVLLLVSGRVACSQTLGFLFCGHPTSYQKTRFSYRFFFVTETSPFWMIPAKGTQKSSDWLHQEESLYIQLTFDGNMRQPVKSWREFSTLPKVWIEEYEKTPKFCLGKNAIPKQKHFFSGTWQPLGPLLKVKLFLSYM